MDNANIDIQLTVEWSCDLDCALDREVFVIHQIVS